MYACTIHADPGSRSRLDDEKQLLVLVYLPVPPSREYPQSCGLRKKDRKGSSNAPIDRGQTRDDINASCKLLLYQEAG